MISFIPAVLAIEICCIVFTLGFVFLPAFRNRKKDYLTKSFFITFISLATSLVISVFISGTTLFEKAPSVYSGIAVGISCFMGFAVSGFIKHENLRIFLKRIGIASLVIVMLEGIVFNFRSFTQDTKNYIVDFSQTYPEENSGNVQVNPDNVVFDINGGTLIIPVHSDKIGSASVEFESEDKFFKTTLFMTDENFSEMAMPVGSKFTSGEYKEPLVFGINGYGKIKELKINVSDVQYSITLKSVKFNTAMPYVFSDTRFLFMMAVAFIVIAIVSFKLYKITYDNKSIFHRFFIAGLAVMCAYTINVFDIPEEKPIEYTSESDVTYNDPYVQMFDYLMEGRLTIDAEPSEELKALENPYDYSLRTNVGYLWDRAYFEGSYYSYYGITPVLLFYFPYYWINDDVPTMNTTCQFFGMLTILFMFGAIMSFVKSFIKKPNFLFLVVSLMSSCVISGVYMSVNFSNQYNVPAITSHAFLMLCLWCGVSACNRLTEKKSIPLFFLCGMAFSLCVASRPSKALSAIILAPLFIGVLLSKQINAKNKIISVISFIVPVIAGLSAVMWYNNARFGSPFDFGQAYQLTVSNINANKINLALLPSAILRYFLQPIDFVGDFPYFGYNSVAICNNGQYVYDAASFGVLSLPFILIGTLIMPVLVWHTRYRKNTKYLYNQNRIRNYTYLIMIVTSVFVAFADYCLGGIIIDYLLDILPVLMIMSILVMLEVQQKTEKFPVISYKLTSAFTISAIISVLLFLSVILTIHSYSIYEHFPAILTQLEKLICFWH